MKMQNNSANTPIKKTASHDTKKPHDKTEHADGTNGSNKTPRPFSEDYRLLVEYKKNPSASESTRLSEFFFSKYINQNLYYCDRFLRLLDSDLAMQQTERDLFLDSVLNTYIPQALNSFNPEKIENKSSYVFATYINFYLRHAVRDLVTKVKKIRNQAISEMNQNTLKNQVVSAEDEVLSKMEKEEQEEAERKIKKELTPLQATIFDLLRMGKKQKDIKLINPKTGKTYTKGYISKEVNTIRYWTKKYLED